MIILILRNFESEFLNFFEKEAHFSPVNEGVMKTQDDNVFFSNPTRQREK